MSEDATQQTQRSGALLGDGTVGKLPIATAGLLEAAQRAGSLGVAGVVLYMALSQRLDDVDAKLERLDTQVEAISDDVARLEVAVGKIEVRQSIGPGPQ